MAVWRAMAIIASTMAAAPFTLVLSITPRIAGRVATASIAISAMTQSNSIRVNPMMPLEKAGMERLSDKGKQHEGLHNNWSGFTQMGVEHGRSR
jgi:hypothetical protein